VDSFRGITSANEETAANCLTLHPSRLDAAVDGYFQNSDAYFVAPKFPPTDGTKIIKAMKYKHLDDPTSMGVEGIMQLCEDLGVDISDIVMVHYVLKDGCRSARHLLGEGLGGRVAAVTQFY
jgi:hypothetical protein